MGQRVRSSTSTIAILVMVWVGIGCGGESVPDVGPDVAADLVPDAGGEAAVETWEPPPFTTDCKTCHDVDSLGVVKGDEHAGAREWMTEQGAGLVRRDPAIPAPGVTLGLPWPSRGRHGAGTECADCHPVRADGLGHGVRTYPAVVLDKVFSGGESCSGACHEWLSDQGASSGYLGADGKTPSYVGSLRPSQLLQGADNAHSTLWKLGLRVDLPPISITVFNPGCGGCHNATEESHGAVVGCLDCHHFGGSTGELHATHVQAIADNAGVIDAQRAGASFCSYCHRTDGVPVDRSNPACYNCHLSGHQPMDKDGRAHFWPI